MRFRLGEDERTFIALRTEVYLRLVAHLPKSAVSEVMRNLQKMEAMAYGEGIKQGMVVASAHSMIVGMEGPDVSGSMSSISAHAQFYGEAETPLVRVEEKRLAELRNGHPWLAAVPVEFPPMTIAEAIAAYGPTLEPAGAHATQRRAPIAVPEGADEREEDLDDDRVLQVRKQLEDAITADEANAQERDEDRAQSPDMLDRIRTQIQTEMRNGWDPKTWPDLILRLMQTMALDASYLDLQLGGEQGRVVLDQCGLHNVFAGGGVVVGPSGEFVDVRT